MMPRLVTLPVSTLLMEAALQDWSPTILLRCSCALPSRVSASGPSLVSFGLCPRVYFSKCRCHSHQEPAHVSILPAITSLSSVYLTWASLVHVLAPELPPPSSAAG